MNMEMNQSLALVIVFGIFFGLLYLGYNTLKTSTLDTKK